MGALTADERAELHALRDLRKTVIGFGGDDYTIMPWVDAHRLHKDEPYIGCVFCRDRFARIDLDDDAIRSLSTRTGVPMVAVRLLIAALGEEDHRD